MHAIADKIKSYFLFLLECCKYWNSCVEREERESLESEVLFALFCHQHVLPTCRPEYRTKYRVYISVP